MDARSALDALGILAAGRERVEHQTRQQRLLEIGVRAATTVFWIGRKDIADRRVRRVCHAAHLVGLAAYAYWQLDSIKVRGPANEAAQEVADRARRIREEDPSFEKAKDDPVLQEAMAAAKQKVIRTGAVVLTLSIGRHLLVAGLRRSRLRYPHLTAGVIVAAAETAYALVRLPKPVEPESAGDDG